MFCDDGMRCVPIGFLSGNLNDEYREVKWQAYDSQVKHKLFAKLGVEAPSALPTLPAKPNAQPMP